MTVRKFRRWDWDNDVGIDALSDNDPIPSNGACAIYDYWNRLCLVKVFPEAGKSSFLLYHYFCDESGRVIEKRSMDEFDCSKICVLVKIYYGGNGDRIKEVAYYPDSNQPPSVWEK